MRGCAPLRRGGSRVTVNSQNGGGGVLPLGKLSGNTWKPKKIIKKNSKVRNQNTDVSPFPARLQERNI